VSFCQFLTIFELVFFCYLLSVMIQEMVLSKIQNFIKSTLKELALPQVDFVIEHPAQMEFGDYATNMALVLAKETNKNPKELAEKIVELLVKNKPDFIESLSVAGPGFINIKLKDFVFIEALEGILDEGDEYGKNKNLSSQKIIVEYTDPNPFKEFHIGHTMSNAIGESIARITEWNGAEVKRACYQGDKGIHVARAVAHKIKTGVEWKSAKAVALSYAEGSKLYESDENFKEFVVEVNKKIYDETDGEINQIYMIGRTLTLEYFETMYKILGTKFDFNFFESTTGEFGKALVRKHTPGVFEESEGAVVFKGEKRDPKLHTRVFINKDGIPTYEAKELGLAKIKYDTYPYDISVVITGNEVNDYFRVLMSALSLIFPELAKKTRHIGHGMMRLPTGKMSSRTGDVVTAESLIEAVSQRVREKMKTSEKDLSGDEMFVSQIAVGAIKYSILRQAPGRDVIFDFDSAVSFEGDSGPYLQYTKARINSLLEKGKDLGLKPNIEKNQKISDLEKMLARFPEIISEAYENTAPHAIATYLIQISGLFNAFYANNQIVNSSEKNVSEHRLAIAKAVGQVIQNGLSVLGIQAPERM